MKPPGSPSWDSVGRPHVACRCCLLLCIAVVSAEDRWGEIFAPTAPPKLRALAPWVAYPPVVKYTSRLLLKHSGARYGRWHLTGSLPPIIEDVMARQFYGMSHADFIRQQPRVRPIRTLSIGCGNGRFEIDIVMRGLTTVMHGIDASPGAIAAAAAMARRDLPKGVDVTFSVGDANTLHIDVGSFDFIFCHHSLHHVALLDRLYAQVHIGLKPGGLFVFEDFVGPSRYQWTPRQLEVQQQVLQALPPGLRLNGLMPAGSERPMHRMHYHTVADMLAADPTEAVNSSQIIPVLKKWFGKKLPIQESIPLGGTLLHPMLNLIGSTWNMSNPLHSSLLKLLCVVDEMMISEMRGESDFMLVVARKPKNMLVARNTTDQGY